MRAKGLPIGFSALCIALVPLTAHASSTPIPYTIVSTGDSITLGFDAGFDCLLQDCPKYSWSTGDSSLVKSHRMDVSVPDAQPW